MHVVIALALVAILSACSTTRVQRASEIEASLPRAIGLSNGVPVCLFLCFVETKFERSGEDSAPPEPSKLNSKLRNDYQKDKNKPPKKKGKT